jgi:hypothetical protein
MYADGGEGKIINHYVTFYSDTMEKTNRVKTITYEDFCVEDIWICTFNEISNKNMVLFEEKIEYKDFARSIVGNYIVLRIDKRERYPALYVNILVHKNLFEKGLAKNIDNFSFDAKIYDKNEVREAATIEYKGTKYIFERSYY